MNIVVISVSREAVRGFTQASEELGANYPGWGTLKAFYVARPPGAAETSEMRQKLAEADTIIVDLMGAHPEWGDLLAKHLSNQLKNLIACGQAFAEQARLGTFVLPSGMGSMGGMTGAMPPKAVRTTNSPPSGMRQMPGDIGNKPSDASSTDARRYAELVRAFRSMRDGDALFIMTSLLHHYGGHSEIEVTEFVEQPDGVFVSHPATQSRYTSLDDYCATHGGPDGRPVVALLFYGRTYPANTEHLAAGLQLALSKHCWVLPIAVSTDAAQSLSTIREYFETPGFTPEVVINLMSFRLGAGPRGGDSDAGVQLLNDVGASYVKPISLMHRTVDEWRDTMAGLSPSEVLVSLMLPELDGCLDEITIAANSTAPDDELANQLVLIDEQVDRLVGRVAGLLRLRHLANQDKRVAIVGYDYPSGEGNLLGGAFLDTAASIEAILLNLREHGYTVTPPEAGQLLNDLLARAVNSPAYLTEQMVTYSPAAAKADLDNPHAWAQVRAQWPELGSAPMVDPEGNFLIPAVDYGNVLVGIQPGRGGDSGGDHDNTQPPHPQYLAFYTWLREVWKADVIVHIGTHGTLEFLQAKENAVSTRCFPDLMLADVPHVYLYYAGNASEGLIARRRSHACLVSYQPPVMRPGGLHDELAELANQLADYRTSLTMAPQTADDLLNDLVQMAATAHLPTDPAELEAELERLGTGLVPLGLHVFGSHWDDDEVAEMVTAALTFGIDNHPPAIELLAAADGQDPDSVHHWSAAERAALDARLSEMVKTICRNPETRAHLLTPHPSMQALVRSARDLRQRFASNTEWDGLHAALNGRYVEARLGGDVIRSSEVMPSGASLYQFDPRSVPSPVAYRRGCEVAEGVRRAYREANDGAEPTSVGVVLWGLETSRTQGETYGQIMALLGVRPVEAVRPGQRRWQIIPASELNGPRVDVVVTICGFFRDLFGLLIEEIDDMVSAIADLDEPAEINPIAARVRSAKDELRAKGLDESAAGEFSKARVFGPAPGVYGTGLTTIIEDGQWDSTADLADAFLNAAQHVYGRNAHGVAVEGLYRSQLAHVEVVSQTRSSNEYQITDLDHYFEYLGGLSASVAATRGEPVATLVTDTTGRRVHTADAADATRAGLYTRLLNPAWQEAMLAHGHRGVTEISDRTTNLLGLAATTAQVDDWMFDAVCDDFIGDEAMRQRLIEANPHASADLAARLTEAHRRGLWQATEERQQLLDDLQFDIDAELEGAGDPPSA